MNPHKYLLLDAHSDILMDVEKKRTLGRKRVIEEDWVPKMRRGGIDARITITYVDDAFLPEMALRRALDQVSVLHSEVDESPSVCMCTTREDIRNAKENGKIGLILGMEGAEPLVNDINLLQVFYMLGLRHLGLTHSRRNYVGDGSFLSPKKAGKPGGLTDFGIEVVQKANDLGIVIDVSHINDPGFWDVIENTKSPIIASHSNCRELFNHPRNLTDDQIKAIAEKGGVIGITPVPWFVTAPSKNADVDHVLKHLDHVVDLVGVKNVGFGFDFYEYLYEFLSEQEKLRVGSYFDFSPSNIYRDEDVPNLIKGLAERGYTDEENKLILGENFLRVFGEVWKS